jgi:sugar phosphate isomerase/epimerase
MNEAGLVSSSAGTPRQQVAETMAPKRPRDEFPNLAPKGGFFGKYDIKYEGPDSLNPLAFKYYNANEKILGKPMKDWLRFAVCYWHTWRGNGADIFGLGGSITRPWDGDDLDAALLRVDVHFEFLQKLGIEYYCFHDRDVAPEGATIAETEAMFDKVADKLAARQAETGIKLLWGTCNLFSHPRYMHGSATNPDPAVVCRAAAAVKKCLEVTLRLGGENFVMWGGRDGYQSLLNTMYGKELENYAQFLRLTASYAKKIGFKGQLLLEPKPREPSTHQCARPTARRPTPRPHALALRTPSAPPAHPLRTRCAPPAHPLRTQPLTLTLALPPSQVSRVRRRTPPWPVVGQVQLRRGDDARLPRPLRSHRRLLTQSRGQPR